MKSNISCWRLVRSIFARLPDPVDDVVERTLVRTVATAVDGCKAWAAMLRGMPTCRPIRVRPPGMLSLAARCRLPATRRGYTRALCARGGIGRRARLRALWALRPVVVRVHSSACEKALLSGAFCIARLGPQPQPEMFGFLSLTNPTFSARPRAECLDVVSITSCTTTSRGWEGQLA